MYELFPISKPCPSGWAATFPAASSSNWPSPAALVSQPKVLLLDEPTEGIQPNIITQIGQVLHHLVDQLKMTVVLVEQYLDFVKEFGHQFYIMNRGRVVAEGGTSELTEIVHQHLSV